MRIPSGLQAVADHGALYSHVSQELLQEQFERELGDYRWDVDLPEGRIWFTSNADESRVIEARAQVVASIAPGPRSVLWGWAHPQAVHTDIAQRLRQIGEQQGIPDLANGELPFETTATGDQLADDIANLAHVIIAATAEATGASAFYSAPTGGSARMVFQLDGISTRRIRPAHDGPTITRALTFGLSEHPRSAFHGLARHAGHRIETSPDGTTDTLIADDGERFLAEWKDDRLARSEFSMGGSGWVQEPRG